MDTPLLQDRDTKPKPRTESIFGLKALRELGEPKIIKETDIFERKGAKPAKKKKAVAKPKKTDRFAPPRSKEQPKRLRSQQGRKYRKD
jgi:hypothetical protein